MNTSILGKSFVRSEGHLFFQSSSSYRKGSFWGRPPFSVFPLPCFHQRSRSSAPYVHKAIFSYKFGIKQVHKGSRSKRQLRDIFKVEILLSVRISPPTSFQSFYNELSLSLFHTATSLLTCMKAKENLFPSKWWNSWSLEKLSLSTPLGFLQYIKDGLCVS